MYNSMHRLPRLIAATCLVATGHATAAPTISGNTLSWPDDGWYQVQNADTYESLCEGGRSCEVPAGFYNVINLTTGQRFERVEVVSTGDGQPGGGDGVYPASIDPDTAATPTPWSFNGEPVTGSYIADTDGDGLPDFMFTTSDADASPCESRVIVLSSLADSHELSSDDLPDTLQLSSTLFAEKNFDGNGCFNIDSVDNAGDINGDGLEDLSIFMDHTPLPPYYETFYQSSAVVFGSRTGVAHDVVSLDGENGFLITGTHTPIDGVGDVNGDGYGDYAFQNSGFFKLSEVHLRPGSASLPARRVAHDILDEPSMGVFPRGTRLSALGDVNADGLADFATSNYPLGSRVYPGSMAGNFVAQPSGYTSVYAVGDHDNDGVNDILVSEPTSGCGFNGQIAAILYGSQDHDEQSLNASIADFGTPGQTRLLSSNGNICGLSTASLLGDINGDGADDVWLGSNVLFGTPGRRASVVSPEDLDGSNGFRLTSPSWYLQIEGADVDGDGYTDMIINGESLIQGMPTVPLDPAGPQQIVVQQRQGAWTVHWQSPGAEAAAYTLSINGYELATVSDASSTTISDPSLDAGGILLVSALDDNGNELGSNVRQVPAYEEYGELSANVYGPKAIELPFNGESRYVNGLYFLVWRNGELIDRTSPSGVRSYFDTGVQPGQIYHYYIQPDYLLGNRFEESNLRQWPLLQRESRTVEAWTPLEGVELPPSGSGVLITDGNTLYWPDDGLYRVRNADDGSLVCEGGLACQVPNGTYDVSNETTGESYPGIVINKPDDNAVPDGITPSTPSNVTLGIYSPRVAELFWERPPASERVVRTEIFRDGEYIGASRGTSYYDGTRTSGTAHWYELIAVDADGDRSAAGALNIQRALQILQPVDPATTHTFDYDTALDGNTAAIGSSGYQSGSVTLLERDTESGIWNITQQIEDDSNRSFSTVFGSHVELSGNTLAIIGSDATEENYWNLALIIYSRNDAGLWQKTQKINGHVDSADSVSISGDTMAVRRDDGIEIYSRDAFSGLWIPGQLLPVVSDNRYPDRPLVLVDDYLAVGRMGHLEENVEKGAVYLYRRDADGLFSLEQQLVPSASTDITLAGQSMAFDGETVVVSGADGRMVVFERDADDNWEQSAELDAVGPNYLTPELAVDGDRLLAGSTIGGGLLSYSGVVVVFGKQDDGGWGEVTRLVPDSGANFFGSSVNLEGNKALVGAGISLDNDDNARVASGHYFQID